MPADLPPTPPERRSIELVPLGDATADAATVPGPADAPRPFPHLVVEPIPAWPAPAVRTSRHPAVHLAAVPDLVLAATVADAPDDDLELDLPTGAHLSPVPPLAPATGDVIDLTGPAPVVVPGPARPTPERLRALLARERAALEDPAPAVTPAADASVAPFPLPTVEVPRRTPKAVRPDVSPTSLSAQLTAAMARATGAAPAEPEASPAPLVSLRARDRLELVPLGDPVPAPPAPVIDLRDTAPAGPTAHPCPACGAAGIVDVIDQIVGEAHLSCPQCFRMWRTSLGSRAGHEAR